MRRSWLEERAGGTGPLQRLQDFVERVKSRTAPNKAFLSFAGGRERTAMRGRHIPRPGRCRWPEKRLARNMEVLSNGHLAGSSLGARGTTFTEALSSDTKERASGASLPHGGEEGTSSRSPRIEASLASEATCEARAGQARPMWMRPSLVTRARNSMYSPWENEPARLRGRKARVPW